jgi:hypothetical protein
LRWSFRCDASFRETMRRKYPDTYAQLESEDHLFVLSCSKRPKPPQRPVP